MKKLAMTLAALALFGSAAQAETKHKMVGNWLVSSQDDAFDKGGTYSMITGNEGVMFAIRCLQKTPTFAIGSEEKLTPGQTFTVKLRIDRGDIVEVSAYALSEHVIQAENDFKIWKAMAGGKELAVHLENEIGTSEEHVFKIAGAAAALPTVTRECPITD